MTAELSLKWTVNKKKLLHCLYSECLERRALKIDFEKAYGSMCCVYLYSTLSVIRKLMKKGKIVRAKVEK